QAADGLHRRHRAQGETAAGRRSRAPARRARHAALSRATRARCRALSDDPAGAQAVGGEVQRRSAGTGFVGPNSFGLDVARCRVRMNSHLPTPVGHAWNPREVARGSDLAEARIAQQRLHGLRLIETVLERKYASARKIARRRRDDGTYGIQAVASRYECRRGPEAQVTLTEMCVL